MKCPQCHRELPDGAKFCIACGTDIVAAARKKRSRKSIGLLCILALVCVVAGLWAFRGAPGRENVVFYTKSDELTCTSADWDSPKVLTFRMKYRTGEDYENSYWYHCNSLSDRLTDFNADCSAVLYPDHIDPEYGSYSLFLQSLTKPGENPVQIAVNVGNHETNSDFSRILYEIWDEESLYLYLDGEPILLHHSVEDYAYTPELEHVYFLDQQSRLMYTSDGRNTSQVDWGVSRIHTVCDDGTIYYYSEQNGFYRCSPGGSACRMPEGTTLHTIDPVTDRVFCFGVADLSPGQILINDAGLGPEETEAIARDLSSALELFKLTVYDKGEQTPDTMLCMYPEMYPDAFVLLREMDPDGLPKILCSELLSVYAEGGELYELLQGKYWDLFAESGRDRMLVAGRLADFGYGEEYASHLTADRSALHYITFDYKADQLMLYTVDLTGEEPVHTMIDTSPSLYSHVCNDSGSIAYVKDRYDELGTLYADGKMVSNHVDPFAVAYQGDALYYLARDPEDPSCAALKVYQKGRSTTIAENVCEFGFSTDGSPVYLVADVSGQDTLYDLYLYDGKSGILLDTDVEGIFPSYQIHS